MTRADCRSSGGFVNREQPGSDTRSGAGPDTPLACRLAAPRQEQASNVATSSSQRRSEIGDHIVKVYAGWQGQGYLNYEQSPVAHLIDLYPGIYQGPSTEPQLLYRLPQLTYADDHPGNKIPALRFAFEVTPSR